MLRPQVQPRSRKTYLDRSEPDLDGCTPADFIPKGTFRGSRFE
jgi:hypothetical protein